MKSTKGPAGTDHTWTMATKFWCCRNRSLLSTSYGLQIQTVGIPKPFNQSCYFVVLLIQWQKRDFDSDSYIAASNLDGAEDPSNQHSSCDTSEYCSYQYIMASVFSEQEEGEWQRFHKLLLTQKKWPEKMRTDSASRGQYKLRQGYIHYSSDF